MLTFDFISSTIILKVKAEALSIPIYFTPLSKRGSGLRAVDVGLANLRPSRAAETS
jgi:hypothetical protein